jgi:hypothetical protein
VKKTFSLFLLFSLAFAQTPEQKTASDPEKNKTIPVEVKKEIKKATVISIKGSVTAKNKESIFMPSNLTLK